MNCVIDGGETTNTGTRTQITSLTNITLLTVTADTACDPLGALVPSPVAPGVIVRSHQSFVTLDSNNSCGSGPTAVYYSLDVYNPTGSALSGLTVTVGGITQAEANPGGFSGRWLLILESRARGQG